MSWRDPDFSKVVVNRFAAKVMRRLYAAGDRTMQVDDVRQELWIAWCIACKSYDETREIPFHIFLRNGMRLHINRYLEKHVGRRHAEVIAKSLDATLGEDGATVHETVASEDPLPFEAIEKRSNVQAFMKTLKPIPRKFIGLLYEQPEALMLEVNAMRAKADYAATLDMVSMNTGRLTRTMIFDLMGVDKHQRPKILAEIDVALKRFLKETK